MIWDILAKHLVNVFFLVLHVKMTQKDHVSPLHLWVHAALHAPQPAFPQILKQRWANS